MNSRLIQNKSAGFRPCPPMFKWSEIWSAWQWTARQSVP